MQCIHLKKGETKYLDNHASLLFISLFVDNVELLKSDPSKQHSDKRSAYRNAEESKLCLLCLILNKSRRNHQITFK